MTLIVVKKRTCIFTTSHILATLSSHRHILATLSDPLHPLPNCRQRTTKNHSCWSRSPIEDLLPCCTKERRGVADRLHCGVLLGGCEATAVIHALLPTGAEVHWRRKSPVAVLKCCCKEKEGASVPRSSCPSFADVCHEVLLLAEGRRGGSPRRSEPGPCEGALLNQYSVGPLSPPFSGPAETQPLKRRRRR